MTGTGHNARTAAIIENLRRRSEIRTRDPVPLARLDALEAQVEALTSALTEAAASQAQLLDICRALDQRIDGVSVQTKQVAA